MSETPPPTEGSSTPEGTPPAAPGPETPQVGAPSPAPDMGDPVDVEKNKVFALLAYLGILVLVPILAARDSPFAKYHANQGLLLTGGMIVIWFVMVFVYIVVHFIPFLGILLSCLSCFIFPLLMLAWLAYAILGIVNAVNGKMKPLPGFPAITLIK